MAPKSTLDQLREKFRSPSTEAALPASVSEADPDSEESPVTPQPTGVGGDVLWFTMVAPGDAKALKGYALAVRLHSSAGYTITTMWGSLDQVIQLGNFRKALSHSREETALDADAVFAAVNKVYQKRLGHGYHLHGHHVDEDVLGSRPLPWSR